MLLKIKKIRKITINVKLMTKNFKVRNYIKIEAKIASFKKIKTKF